MRVIIFCALCAVFSRDAGAQSTECAPPPFSPPSSAPSTPEQAATCGGWLRLNLARPCMQPKAAEPPQPPQIAAQAAELRCARLACDPAASKRAFPEFGVLRRPDLAQISPETARLIAAARLGRDPESLISAAQTETPATAALLRSTALMLLLQNGVSFSFPDAGALFSMLGGAEDVAPIPADVDYLFAARALSRGEFTQAAAAAERALSRPGESAFYQAHLVRVEARLRLARQARGSRCGAAYQDLVAAAYDLGLTSPCARHLGRLHGFLTARTKAPETDAPLALTEAFLSTVLGHKMGWRAASARLAERAQTSQCAALALTQAQSLSSFFSEQDRAPQ